MMIDGIEPVDVPNDITLSMLRKSELLEMAAEVGANAKPSNTKAQIIQSIEDALRG